MRETFYSLSGDDGVYWATCKQCGVRFNYEMNIWGKKRLLKWMAYHRLTHQLTTDVHEDQ